MRSLGALSIGLALSLLAQRAHAESCLSSIAAELAAGLQGEVRSGLLACGAVRSSEGLRGEGELSSRVCRVLASKLSGVTLLEGPQTAQSAWKRAPSASRLTFVDLELSKGQLHASLDVHERATNVWERLKGKKPAPIAHAAASAPIDAEVRHFLPQLALEEVKISTYKLGELAPHALACGPFGNNPGNQLALLTTTELLLGRLRRGSASAKRAGAFHVERRAPVTALGPRAPVPIRPPISNVVALSSWSTPLAAGSSDRGFVLFDRELGPAEALRAMPFAFGGELRCAALDPVKGGYVGLPGSCQPPAEGRAAEEPKNERVFDALAMTELVGRDGDTQPAWAGREPSGKLHLRVGDRQSTTEAVGAQLALGDLDQDGTLEVIYSLDSDDDALVLASFDGKGLRLRKRWPTKAKIAAVAVCPPEDEHTAAVVALVGNEVWVVR